MLEHFGEVRRRREGHETDGLRGSGAPRGDLPRREVRRVSLRLGRSVGRVGDEVGDGERPHLTRGSVAGPAESRDPDSRPSSDGAQVTLWCRLPDSVKGGGSTRGGRFVPWVAREARLEGRCPSSTGRPRETHGDHPPEEGDPLSSPSRREGRTSNRRGAAGVDNHFPVGRRRCLHRLRPRAAAERRRLAHPSDGGEPSGDLLQLTRHLRNPAGQPDAQDPATDDDGFGPGPTRSTSNAAAPTASAWASTRYMSPRRVRRSTSVATVSRATAGLWRVPIADGVIRRSPAATPIPLPTHAVYRRGRERDTIYRAPRSERMDSWSRGWRHRPSCGVESKAAHWWNSDRADGRRPRSWCNDVE